MEDKNNRPLILLHEQLVKDNYAIPSDYTEFEKTFQNPDNAKSLFDQLTTDKYAIPSDYDSFVSTFGLKKKDASEYGFPTKEVFSQIFANISKEDIEAQGYNTEPPKEFKTLDLTLKSPEFKGYEEPSLTQVIGQTLSRDRIALQKEDYKKEAENRIQEINTRLKELPETKMQTGDVAFGTDVSFGKVPEEDEKLKLQDERTKLTEAITTPTKAQYLFGKAYSKSIIGLASKIATGSDLVSPEWLEKFDASTLTDVTATTLGFLLDMPFFGAMGKIGAKIGEIAAKPFVDRAMVKTAEKLIKTGFSESVAKELVLKAATKTSQVIAGMSSSGVALGSYTAVTSALSDWAQPNASFDDIKWGNAFKTGAKNTALGIGAGGLGIASAVIASKASAIPNAVARIGTKIGVATGGLTAESGLFTYGGALLDGRKLKDVTGKEFLETMSMLTMLKVSNVAGKIPEAIAEPKKTAIKLYQSLKYNSGKPGTGVFEVDIEPWEVDVIGAKDYKSAMNILAKDDVKLGEILQSEEIPALLKQKLLWGSRGVAMPDIDLYADKVETKGEYINIYNKEGVLVDKRKVPTSEDATQEALNIGLQLEDNKMQMKSAAPETDKVKIISELKAKGTDIPAVLNALDKPVADRTPEENKIVGDYSKLVPKGNLKPPEEPLTLGDKTFTDKSELFKYLDENAIDKETGQPTEGWMDIKELPNSTTLKAVNEWEATKKQPEKTKAESTYKTETPEEAIIRIKDRLAGLRDDYNAIPKSYNKKRGAVMRQIQSILPEGYQVKVEGDGITVLNEKGKKLIRSATAKETVKFADIKDPEQKKFITMVLNAKEHLYGLDFPIGGKLLDKAVDDLLAGKSNQNTQYIIDGLSDMYKRGAMKFKGENQPDIEITTKEVQDQISDAKLKTFMEKNGGLTVENVDKAAEAGLIDKADIEDVKKIIQDENDRRSKDQTEWAAEEANLGGGSDITPESEETLGENKKPEEVKPETKLNEEPINEPNPPISKGEENIISGGTENIQKPIASKGEEKPVRTIDVVKQKKVDAIDKDYDAQIADAQKELDGMTEEKRREIIAKAEAEVNRRNTIFGDADVIKDGVIKPEDQGFVASNKPIEEVARKFDERKVELTKQIDALNKERESKIGEVLKQQTLGFEEPIKQEPIKEIPKVGEEVMVEFQGKKHKDTVLHVYSDGRIDIDYFGMKTLTPDRYETIAKEIPKEGIIFKNKNYQSVDDVQDALDRGEITFEEQKPLLQKVREFEKTQNKPESFADSKTAKQNKKYKNEPKTDTPEELAWDQPLPLSPAEDPNFKNSDLNNAMSIRNLARNLIKNLGLEEGADIRVGFIKRFARKARGIFNPVSGIIRVRNIRDLRALTHEIGHKLDFEIFDIRGIISASKSDPNLGMGIDFNGKVYSDVAQVENAMKNRTITINDGNYLLEKVKTFEKKKLGEKYSEIVEQGGVIGVKYKNKTYKSDKEINNALAKGIMPTKKASELIIKLNANNKGRAQRLDKLRAKYGDDVVAGVLQRVEMKKEFDSLLRDVGYPSTKREEGIAEFVYNYVIDPKQLINSTPTTLAWFEKMLDNAPEIKNALHKLREEFATYDAQDIRTKMVAEIVPPEPEKVSWLDTIVKLGKDPMYSIVNMLRPVEIMVKNWKIMMDNNVLAYKDPWLSAKQLLGQGGRSEQWILYHPYFNRKNDVIIRYDIKGLMPILKPILGTTDYLPYQTYLVALDAIESHNRGKPEQAYFDKETALAGKAAFEKQYGAAKLMEFQGNIQKYNEALLDFSAESGIFSEETAKYWKQEHQNYVPLRRIAETYEIMGGKKKTITRDLLPESEKVIFSRKGSQKQIRDIFESMIENTNHILASSERNILNRNLADMFFDIHNYNKSHKTGGAVIEEIDARGMEAYQDPTTGEIRYSLAKVRPKNFRPPKGRILVVKEEGNPRFYDVAPEYYDDIFRVTNMVAKNVSRVMRVLSAPSHWLQAGAVVYDPTFPVRNIIRDQTSTWFTSKHGYLPTDFMKGIFSAIKKDNLYQKWLASGGDQSFLVSADQAMSKNYFDQKVGKFARRKFDAYKRNPLLALQDFSKASEIGTRLGAFKNAYKRTGNVKLAAIESRDITADYGIHGAMTKQLFQLYPFLNARIQWARTMVESMKNPASFMLKGMALAIPAAINWLINNQDEESQKLYQSLPTWRRVGLFNVRIPGTDHFLPLPKGFYGVLFASSIESLLDATAKDDPRVLAELPKQLFQEISPISNWPEVIPFLARPQIEMWANKKGYTGKPIISESMKLLKPSEQYYNSTPEIIKKLGEALNWSPVKIEHYFKSYTGGAGIGAVNILDETLQAIGLVDKKPEDTFTMLSRMPIFKALLTERPIGLSSGYVSDFYGTLDKIEKVNVTFNNYVKTENLDGLEKFMSDPENKKMYSFYEGNSTALNAFRSALTFARDSGYAVMKDETLTNIEKQTQVRRINDVIQETVLKFKNAYEKKEFFDYGKTMSDIVDKMREEKKDYRNELAQQQQTYNPYWMQLRSQNKNVYERLKEFGGLRDIEQTRSITKNGEKIDLELEDVRLFNETLVKRYGENVANMIGIDKTIYEDYQKITDPMDVEKTQLKQLLDSAWDTALAETKNDFQPQQSNKVK